MRCSLWWPFNQKLHLIYLVSGARYSRIDRQMLEDLLSSFSLASLALCTTSSTWTLWF